MSDLAVFNNLPEFNRAYGMPTDSDEGARCEVVTETWLSAPKDLDPQRAASADYVVDDAMNNNGGWQQTIEGRIVELTTLGDLYLTRQLPELSSDAMVLVLRSAQVMTDPAIHLTPYTFIPADRISEFSATPASGNAAE